MLSALLSLKHCICVCLCHTFNVRRGSVVVIFVLGRKLGLCRVARLGRMVSWRSPELAKNDKGAYWYFCGS